MVLRLIDTERSELTRSKNIRWHLEYLYWYITFRVRSAEVSILLTSSDDGREKTMRILHQSVYRILVDLELSCTEGRGGRAGNNKG